MLCRPVSGVFRGSAAAGAQAVLAALVLSAQIVLAQQAVPPDEPDPPATAPPAQTAPQEPTLLESIGRFFEQGFANFRTHVEGAKQKMDDLNQKALSTSRSIGEKAAEVGRDAAEVVVKPLTSRIVSGHERCATAPNGAPDCVAAAEAMCRKQGFTTGKSIDFTSARDCPPKVYLSGRQTGPECTTVTFISRAMCQ